MALKNEDNGLDLQTGKVAPTHGKAAPATEQQTSPARAAGKPFKPAKTAPDTSGPRLDPDRRTLTQLGPTV